MIADRRATRVARVLHGRGIKALNKVFLFDPENPPKKKRKHAKHDLRWRRRKITAASRKANR